MQLNPNQVLETVQQIRKDAKNGMDKGQLEKKYVEFYDRYPTLFLRAREPSQDLGMVEFMIRKLNQHHDSADAGKEVGEVLFKKYIPKHLLKK